MSSSVATSVNERPQVVNSAARYGFGKNWERFLGCLTEERIAEAEHSLWAIFRVQDVY